MKKLICIFLTAALLLVQPFVPAFAEDEALSDFDSVVRRLQYFGLAEKTDYGSPETTVTRGKFVKLFAKYLQIEDMTSERTERYFYDVPDSSDYLPALHLMCDLGYVSLPEDRLFRPDDNLTYREAYLFITRAMGFGGIPESESIVRGVRRELYRGITDGGDEAIPALDLLTMLDNALDTDMLLATGVREENGENVLTYETTDFLSGYYQIETAKGIVDGTPITALQKDVVLNSNQASVDGVVYELAGNVMHIREYLGYYVKVYYREDNSKKEILYFEDLGTDEVVITSDEFESYNAGVFTYRPKNSTKSRTIKMQDSAYVIFNGVLLENYDASIFDIKNGSIEFVGQSGYNVVKVYDYTDIVVGGVSATGKKIYSKNTEAFYDLENYDNVIIRDESGRNIKLEEVKPNQVASVATSGDDLIIINVSSGSATGMVEYESADEQEVIWVIGGKEYKFSPSYRPEGAVVGTEVTAYLNYKGLIAYYAAKTKNAMAYGYLINGAEVGVFGGAQIRMLTEESDVKVFPLATTVNVDGIALKSTAALTALSYENVTDVTPSNEVQPQAVKYLMNENGEVVKIDTARKLPEENGRKTLTKEVSNQKLTYFSHTERLTNYTRDWLNASTDCLLGTDTKVFVVPGVTEDAKDVNNEQYFSATNRAYFVFHESYYVDVYDVDREEGALAGAVVVRLDDMLKAPIYGLNGLIVTDVRQTVNSDGVPIKSLRGMRTLDGGEQTLIGIEEKDVFGDIQPGDLIRYGYVNGRVTGTDRCIDIRNAPLGHVISPRELQIESFDGPQSAFFWAVSRIVDIKGKWLYCGLSREDKKGKLVYDMSNADVFVYDLADNRMTPIEAGTLSEYIKDDSVKVMIGTERGRLSTVVVYENI